MTKKEELNERRLKAFQLRKEGKLPPEIATIMGVSLASVYSYIEDGRTAYYDNHPDEKLHVRSLELARLDDMTAGIYEQAKSGDTKAIDAMIKIMDRRAKFLGLDAPAKQEIETKTSPVSARDLSDDELAAIIRSGSH